MIFSTLLEGVNNSLITARKGFLAYSWNEHILFVLQRGCIPLILFIILEDWKLSLLLLVIDILQFSFFHNGAYGESMRRIGFKEYSWTYNSPTSTAKIELNFVVRSILLILGVIILIYKLTT